MTSEQTHSSHFITAFAGERLLASGPEADVKQAIRERLAREPDSAILVFDDLTGRGLDFDMRETPDVQHGTDSPVKRTAGRPKLGVVSREVTLLPRQWEWLAQQPGGASVTIRKLVDAARKGGDIALKARNAQQAADRFMLAMLGNQPGYEDASRALYAADQPAFLRLSEAWPPDLRDHARRLAEPAFDSRKI